MFDAEFYPTPMSVAHAMLSKIDKDATHFLEPSAGKGDIADVIRGNKYDHNRRKVDCIERDPELVQILTGKEYTIVGHDWLDYSGVCYYDAIVMNPPFSNGDDHLLRAWDFMHHGEIVCPLNEETIKNPHTAARKRLAEIIAQHGTVEFKGEYFSTAQRKSDVRVAMVYLKKVSADDTVDLWARTSDEKIADEDIGSERHMLAIKDTLGNMEHYYNMANEHMLKAFQHVRKASLYLAANGIDAGADAYDKALSNAFKNTNAARAVFASKHRRDAWMEVFKKTEFERWLDKKQTAEFIRDIERSGDVPFTADNIKGTLENVFEQRSMLFEKSVANVFDDLTRYFKGNTNHTEGWKTNDSYKVNKKIVFPYGCEFDGKFCKNFSMSYRGVTSVYRDIDRILCVLDGENLDEVLTIGAAMEYKFRQLGHGVGGEFDSQTQSRYFNIRFFKKGTVHLTWKDDKLWEQFNLTAAKGKRWLGDNTKGGYDPNAHSMGVAVYGGRL